MCRNNSSSDRFIISSIGKANAPKRADDGEVELVAEHFPYLVDAEGERLEYRPDHGVLGGVGAETEKSATGSVVVDGRLKNKQTLGVKTNDRSRALSASITRRGAHPARSPPVGLAAVPAVARLQLGQLSIASSDMPDNNGQSLHAPSLPSPHS